MNFRKMVLLAEAFCMVIAPTVCIADTLINGDLQLRDGGGLVFPDHTKQNTAQVQGPKGDTGLAGPANSLTIGNITTGNPGTTAGATITGVAPNQTLNLLIPQGPQGPIGLGGYSFPWQSVTSSVTANPDTGYIAVNNSSRVVITLPSSAALGSIIKVTGAGSAGWQVEAQEAGSILQGVVTQYWTRNNLNGYLYRISSSANGSKMVVSNYSSNSYHISFDSGQTWTQRNYAEINFGSMTISPDGAKMFATSSDIGGGLYISTNDGISWTHSAKDVPFLAVASSYDGAKLVATTFEYDVYTSIDSGVTWIKRITSPITSGFTNNNVTSSADGTKLAATFGNGVLISNNSGESWKIYGPSGLTNIISSYDGTKLATAGIGGVYTSSDSGVTWVRSSYLLNECGDIASSSDGVKLATGCSNDHIYISTDSGVTWIPHEAKRSWGAITSSADGTKLAALSGYTVYISPPNMGMPSKFIGGPNDSIEFQCISANPLVKYKVSNSYGLVISQ